MAKSPDVEKLDLRTRKGRELEVINCIQEYGGFNPWWAWENDKRYRAVQRLQEAGVIVRLFSSPPFYRYTVNLDKWEGQ